MFQKDSEQDFSKRIQFNLICGLPRDTRRLRFNCSSAQMSREGVERHNRHRGKDSDARTQRFHGRARRHQSRPLLRWKRFPRQRTPHLSLFRFSSGHHCRYTFHLPRHLFPATERNVRGAENECPRMRTRNINARLSAGTPGPRVSGNSMGSSSFPGLLRREIRRYLITRRLAVRQYETKPLCLRPRTGQEPGKRSFAEPHTCV